MQLSKRNEKLRSVFIQSNQTVHEQSPPPPSVLDQKPGYQSTTPAGTEPSLTTNPLKLESTEEVKNFTLTTGESRGGSRTTWAAEPTDHLGIESWARPS